MDDKLARVSWKMGQTLLPEHLTAMEDFLLADTVLRFRVQGLPAYGIGKLILNETLLSEGIFSVQEMTLVLSSGLLLSVPGNVRLSPFNLNLPGTIKVAVYLHLLEESPAADSSPEGWGDEVEEKIPRLMHRMALSSEQDYANAIETLKLAEFQKSPQGVWQISRDYVPPLLQMGTSPFLRSEIDALAEALALFQYNLYMDAVSYLSGDSLSSVKQCLKSVFRTQRLLANLVSQVHLHPFYLCEELLTLYTEVCFYRNTTPENITSAYNHDQLAFLHTLIDLISKQMQMVRSLPPYLPFELSDNIYRVKLPDEIRQATNVYLLAQKDRVISRLSLEDVKLASLSRLPVVHKMALQGVPFKRVEHPSFQHAFGAEVEFYLIKEGEEWDHALTEMMVAFYNRPELKDTAFYIFWRIE
ncbi:type VI secretion system protein ImpJ [Syntrophus gentianae]|uniref:Type VI secretion system protein ImpJ n=1 Tax=Syntrophus gentianae TaxID=43775 RepID=A0A1H7VJB5_9BACT|nr:type VI secretion system baseplate subunit TssK [Syntrophus gentianae]SEM09362.1 type VI secretion system protein ImpJ [Syntrophus gentianae]